MHAGRLIHMIEAEGRTRATNVHWIRVALLIGGAVALFYAGRALADLLILEVRTDFAAGNEVRLHRAIMAALAAYVISMATPFMPGVEIGLGLLMLFGARVSFLVYASTLVSLSIAYLVGRFIPADLAARGFGSLGLSRAEAFLSRLAPLGAKQRMAVLVQEAPGRWGEFLVRHRYLCLALILNLPGNIVVGGGGGIAIAVGMTRLFPFPWYLLTVAVATAPVPLMVFLTG